MTQIIVPSINFHLPTQVLIPLTFVKQIVKSKIPSYLKDQAVPIISHATLIATKSSTTNTSFQWISMKSSFFHVRAIVQVQILLLPFFLPLANIYFVYATNVMITRGLSFSSFSQFVQNEYGHLRRWKSIVVNLRRGVFTLAKALCEYNSPQFQNY